MSYKQEKIIVIVSEFINDKREYYPITDVPVEKARFFYKDNDGLFKIMSSSDYAVRTETNETRLYITNENIKNESSKFQMGYEINFTASEYKTSLPVLSVLVEMYNTLVEDSRTIFNYVKKQCFISDDKTTSLILPTLPAYTVWCMGESGEMFALPVSELYYKFDKMVETLYTEIKTLLIKDYDKFTKDFMQQMLDKTEELKNELDDLKNSLSEEIKKLSSEEKNNISNFANNKKDEVINAIGQVSDEEIKELNTHTDKKKQELDEYIELNKEDLIGQTGPRGFSIGKIIFLRDVPTGKEYEVFLENDKKLGVLLIPKGESIVGPQGIQGIQGKQGLSIKNIVFNKKTENGNEYDVFFESGEKLGTITAPMGPEGKQGIQGIQGIQGNTGVVINIDSQYGFSVNTDGHLILHYLDGATPPDFRIDDNGHLILNL